MCVDATAITCGTSLSSNRCSLMTFGNRSATMAPDLERLTLGWPTGQIKWESDFWRCPGLDLAPKGAEVQSQGRQPPPLDTGRRTTRPLGNREVISSAFRSPWLRTWAPFGANPTRPISKRTLRFALNCRLPKGEPL
jgi:hypothetical protein